MAIYLYLISILVEYPNYGHRGERNVDVINNKSKAYFTSVHLSVHCKRVNNFFVSSFLISLVLKCPEVQQRSNELRNMYINKMKCNRKQCGARMLCNKSCYFIYKIHDAYINEKLVTI
jgi:hypothetical protein